MMRLPFIRRSAQLFTATLMLGCSILLCGCPYASPYPIDEPSIPVDEKLIGKWTPEKDAAFTLTVAKGIDDFHYKIEKRDVVTGDLEMFQAFISEIDGKRYVQAYEVRSRGRNYYFYRIALVTERNMKLLAVTENIDERFTNSAELKAFFARHQQTSFFFDKNEERYVRIDN